MGYIKTFHCFHGTTTEYFKCIKESNRFQFQQRNNHWLGNGVYFFLDDQRKAEWWAKMAVRKSEKQNEKKEFAPCVLYLEAKSDIDKVIDLNTETGQQLVDDFAKYLKQQKIQINIPNVDNLSKSKKEHISRCFLMDLLAISGDYVASCYQFPNNSSYKFEDLGPYGIVNNRGNQLCVYNQEIIDFSTIQNVI